VPFADASPLTPKGVGTMKIVDSFAQNE